MRENRQEGALFYEHFLVDLLPVDGTPGRWPAPEDGSRGASGSTVEISWLRIIGKDDTLAKGIPAGARWITVHPNGPAEKGQPILIQPAGDGAFKVIGGAGGSLNHLRMTGVKSKEDYGKRPARAKQPSAMRRSYAWLPACAA